MERTSPEPQPYGSAQPRSPQPSARTRLASLHRGPTRHWSPAASGPIPLSEALAARRQANHPRWHRLKARLPPTLHARWTLSTTAVVALALLAIAGAALGGWYMTRSQATVVEVGGAAGSGSGVAGGGSSGIGGEGGGGGNAGESNPDGHSSRLSSSSGMSPGTDGALAGSAAAGGVAAGGAPGQRSGIAAEGACPRPGTAGTPHVLGLGNSRPAGVALGSGVGPLRRTAQALSLGGGSLEHATRLRLPVIANSLGYTRRRHLPVPEHAGLVPVSVVVGGSFSYAEQASGPVVSGSRDAASVRVLELAGADSLRSLADRQLRQPSGVLKPVVGAEPMKINLASRHMSAPPPCPSRAGAIAGLSTATVVVDVEGKVVRPGIQALPAGARVYEALAAAGGALAGVDVTSLDLARVVADGEQLRVGIAGEPGPVVGVAGPSGAKGKRKGGRVVNLNAATVEELQAVPGVGPAMAERIVEWRAAHGRFASVGQLRQVRGIGERKFADMRDSVTV